MKEPLPKTLHGKPVTHDAFRLRIIELLSDPEPLSLKDLARLLGPEHETPEGRIKLRGVIRWMVNSKHLIQPKKNQYRATSKLSRDGGLRASDAYETQVLQYIRKNGGLVRQAELFWAFCQDFSTTPYDHRPRTRVLERNKGIDDELLSQAREMQQTAAYTGIQKALQSLVDQRRLHKEYAVPLTVEGPRKDGFYALPPEELAGTIMPPEKIVHILNLGHVPGEMEAENHNGLGRREAQEAVDRHLHSVAMAIQYARRYRRIPIPELLVRPRLVAAMYWWERDCEHDIARHRELRVALRREDDTYPEWTREYGLERLWEDMENFENSEVESRRPVLKIRVEMFRALETELRVSGAGLSHGIVLPMPD